MPEEKNITKEQLCELSDEDLEKVNGGALLYQNGKEFSVAIGDVVNVSGYINGFDGAYCLVHINEYNAHKFVKYTQGAKYVDKAISFSTIPSGVTITKIGHDDEFVVYNA